eukprot:m.166256 g.166256  ORF g.166256 m.166256 type:complete len:870 (-) comp31420_c8_seq2:306-2915(-)
MTTSSSSSSGSDSSSGSEDEDRKSRKKTIRKTKSSPAPRSPEESKDDKPAVNDDEKSKAKSSDDPTDDGNKPTELKSKSKRDSERKESDRDSDRNHERRQRKREEVLVERDPRAEAIARGKTKNDAPNPNAMKTGGAYIPPARLRAMQEDMKDSSSQEYQRLMWNALKKSINGLVNKVNVSNLQNIVLELFSENLVRGRGLLCRCVMKAQMASQTFTHVYAALMAIINTKFPQNGELLLKRLILQFRRSYRRSDKATCLGVCKFIAHLANQQVAHELLALEILTLLFEKPTDDSVEVAIAFLKECGRFLTEVSPRGIHAIFERMRSVLHEGSLDKRTQYMIEVMYAVRKDGFKDHLQVIPELDLVEENDQITHMLSLDEEYKGEELLNVFKLDTDYDTNEQKYKDIRAEILGDGSDDEDDSDADSDEEDEDDDDDDQQDGQVAAQSDQPLAITDMTETNLTILRRTIYLTVMSSANYEECAHKLLKMTLKPGYESELANMIIECCTQERTYLKFYGLLAGRFCEIKREYQESFCQAFLDQYKTVHRLETNKIRQMAKMFAHLFITDAVPWNIFEVIRLNEVDTTASSRIFIKELMMQMSEFLGVPSMVKRYSDPYMQTAFGGLFPKDSPKNTRFAINFFTSIGLGGLTDDLREHLKNAPKMIMAQRQMDVVSDEESDSDASSSDSDSSSSSSDSDSSGSGSSSSGSSSDSSSSSDSDSSNSSAASAPRKKTKRKTSKSSPSKEKEKEKEKDRQPDPKVDISGEEAFAARAKLSKRGGGDDDEETKRRERQPSNNDNDRREQHRGGERRGRDEDDRDRRGGNSDRRDDRNDSRSKRDRDERDGRDRDRDREPRGRRDNSSERESRRRRHE